MKIDRQAFTLVEIMIVVAIIALLAAIAIPNLVRAKINSNDAVAKATLKTIATALENYYTTENQYPPETTSLIGIAPPYLVVDYFNGNHNGFTYRTSTLTPYTYQIAADPVSTNLGTTTFTISTGGVISW